MPARFVTINRDQVLLLPPDINEWVPADHPARLLVELVDTLDLSSASVNESGSGSRQYPPSMMLALILYSYSHGIFSSRKIESLAQSDIAVKYICAMEQPDHDTICSFRRENGALVKDVFCQTLLLAGEMGVLKIGSLNVAIDGSKFKANTSTQAKTIKAINEEIAQLEAHQQKLGLEIDQILERAEATDRTEENLQNPIPGELVDADIRKAKLSAARKMIAQKERRKANLEAAKAVFGEKKASKAKKREQQRDEIKESEYGSVPKPRESEVKESDKVNIADPEAGKMHNYKGYQEGYNVQVVMDADGSGLLLGARVSDEANDRNELIENISEVEDNLGGGCMTSALCDRGYDNTYQITEIEKRGGPTMLCDQQGRKNAKREETTTSAGKNKNRNTRRRKNTRELRDQYYERLLEPGNREKRKKRKTTIEPAFGYIKEALGFRQFSLRGIIKAQIEFDWVSMASNINILNRKSEWVARYSG